MAIRIGNLRSSSLVAKRLAVTRLLVCASPKYLAEYGSPSHPQELADHAIIGYSYWSAGDEWTLRGPDGPVTVRTRASIYSNNGETCLAAALAGQGIILQPDFVVRDDIETGALQELFPEYSAGELGVYTVYPSRRHLAPKLRVLIAFLTEHLGVAPTDLQ